jgi:glycosyltransferase involved in cell wall biosynthesis
MKILHVISGDLWAGAEMQAYTLMSSLRRLDGVEVAAAVMNEGELARRLRQADVAVTVFDESRLGARRIVAGLKELMSRWQPDVVHTHRTKENVLASIANRLARNVPSLRTAHGASEHAPRGLKSKLRHAVIGGLDSWCARYAQERIIAVSSELGKKLESIYPPEKIVVIVNGIDADAVLAQRQPAQFREREPGTTHVGIVGRLVTVKRVDLFLRTAALLQRDSPARQWRFHVFGDGPLRAELIVLAETLGLAGQVTFHGHRQDIVACMAGLDVIVMCSDHEGLPMTALEAVSLGVPMVAHAVGGLTDILPADSLVHQHDAEGYGAAVRRLLERGSGAAAQMQQRVLAEYSCARNAARTLRLYEELSGRTSR